MKDPIRNGCFDGGYADNGIFCTGTGRRTDLSSMIADADEGKTDLILQKSINQFDRNTSDIPETVRYLRKIGGKVWSECENIIR